MRLTLVSFLLGLMLMTSCKKEPVNPAPTDPNIKKEWMRIIKFTKNNTDITSKYAGYLFNFTGDGKLEAASIAVNESGTYSQTPGIPVMTISQFSDSWLSNLSRRWYVVQSNSLSLTLSLDSLDYYHDRVEWTRE